MEMAPDIAGIVAGSAWYWRGTEITVDTGRVDVKMAVSGHLSRSAHVSSMWTHKPPTVCIARRCHRGQGWSPDEHTIRYCDSCKIWMHVECLERWHGKLERASTAILTDKTVVRSARQLFQCPVVRTDWYRQPLWSLEQVIMAARTFAQDAQGRTLFTSDDWRDIFVETVAGSVECAGGLTVEDVQEVLRDVLAAFMEQYSRGTKYSCIRCKHWV